MQRAAPPSAKEPANLARAAIFSLERLLSHADPGPEQESEEFVRAICEQRRNNVAADRNDKTRR